MSAVRPDVDVLREIRAGLGGLVVMIERELGPERAALWSRPDPVALVAEVYGGLAVPLQLLDRLIRQVAEPQPVALAPFATLDTSPLEETP